MRSSRVARIAAATALTSLAGVAGASAAPQSLPGDALESASFASCPTRSERVEPDDGTKVSLACSGLNGAKLRIVEGPGRGELGKVSQRRDRVTYRPDRGFKGADRLIYERRSGGHAYRGAVNLTVGSGDAPRCSESHAIARSESPVEIRIRCRGERLGKLKVNDAGLAGKVENVRHERANGGDTRTLTARYEAPADFSGQDVLSVGASSSPGCSEASIWCGHPGSSIGALEISVLPWRMRAIGDSVTAGFGFIGDSGPMQESQLVACEPPAPPNNRCSSNSGEGANFAGPAAWSDDFGLGNDVSWAAQFANSIEPNGDPVTAPDEFQNLAVTGSAPSDWLSGTLEAELDDVIDEDPELIAMTMGANPLLSDILESEQFELDCAPKTTVNELIACIKPAFDQAQLKPRLEQLYTQILNGAQNANVVTFHYHLADPSLTLFTNWQAEAMIEYMNDQITQAVEGTEQALPEEASRLFLVEAQSEPGSTAPGEVARFNIGLPPASQQIWTAGFDCGKPEMVDGPSHQSNSTQQELANDSSSYCPGDPWIISSDTGIHPNAEGYAQFANALSNVAAANDFVPTAG